MAWSPFNCALFLTRPPQARRDAPVAHGEGLPYFSFQPLLRECGWVSDDCAHRTSTLLRRARSASTRGDPTASSRSVFARCASTEGRWAASSFPPSACAPSASKEGRPTARSFLSPWSLPRRFFKRFLQSLEKTCARPGGGAEASQVRGFHLAVQQMKVPGL